MAYTPQPNTGVLFKNNKKTTDKQPDYTGNMLVGTTEMQLAAWIKEGKNGKFMSLKMSEPNSKTETTSTNDGDDMPF
jgi:uncharacterized protein (DUF736 family)